MAKSLLWFSGTVVCALLFNAPALAQSITPAADDTGTVITLDGNTYQIQGGTQTGANLFHSFQDFGLTAGEIANFLSNPNITNIFGRVTGGNASIIDGLIQANPNLYLMNPAGIMFGANAQLNIGGDFFATTADQLCFEDGCFKAWGTNDFSLLSGSPTTLGFLQNQPGGLVNAGMLRVQKGKSIHLSGGTVVNLGQILAPGGRATVAAVPGVRQVRLNTPGSLLSLEMTDVILMEGIDPLTLPELLTGSGRGSAPVPTPSGFGATTGGLPLQNLEGDVVIDGDISGRQIDLYTAGQVSASDTASIQGDTRVVRFSETGENPDQTVFIDRRADNPEELLFGAAAGTVGQIIERDENGIAVISEQLSMISDSVGELDSVAIVVEGNQGNFWLGNQWIHSENIEDYAAQLQSWGEALTESADLLLYSCFTALGATGEALVNSIASITRADVAASVNATGNANYGGDWVLESSTGSIDASHPFTTGTLANWNGKLATRTVQNLNDTGSGSLRDALTGTGGAGSFWTAAVADGDDINFAPGLTGQIDIGAAIAWTTDNLTLAGPGQNSLILDGGGSGRIFNISANNATIQNLTIRNGSSGSTGGGIFHSGSGTLTLENTTVSDNSANNAGGGIRNDGDIILSNSTISDNFARGDGGGIRLNDSQAATVTNSTISGNFARGNGGGIRFRNNGFLTVTNSTISDNSSRDDGGGVYFRGRGRVQMTDATISGNSARVDGGGIRFNDRGRVVMTNSTISNNSARVDGGGVRFKEIGILTVNNSTISNNSAGVNGGGVRLRNNGTVQIINSTISGNSSNGTSGGIRLNDNGVMTVENSTISGNSTRGHGGAIRFLDNGTVTVTSSTISGNSSGDDGAGIRLRDNGTVTVTSSIISGNSTDDNGAGIRLSNNGILTVSNSTLSGNSSGDDGGAIYLNNNGKLTINNSTLLDNSAGRIGGGIRLGDNGTATVNNSTLSDNSTNLVGGGIGFRDYGTATVNNSTLSGNSAGKEGGGVNFLDNGTVTVSNSTLSGNSAGDEGGGINFLDNGTVTVNNSTISGNSAGLTGGGIDFDNDGTAMVNNSTLSDNSAGHTGGGIDLLNNGTVTVTQSTLSGNIADQRGGGLSSGGDIQLIDTTLSNNQALQYPQSSGVYLSGLANAISITSSGDLDLTDSIQAKYNNSDILLSGQNVNLSVPLQSNGGNVAINATQNVNAVTVDATISSSGPTGGDITIIAGVDLNLRNLVSAGLNGNAGNVTITSTGGIATTTFGGSSGLINANGNNGNGGNVSITAQGATTIGSIFAESFGGTGGNVNLESTSLIRLTQTSTGLFDTNNVSISTAGSNGGGAITIRHGGLGVVPFTVGDASVNGSAGRLSTGTGTLQNLDLIQSFLYDFIQGNIQILSTDAPVALTLPSLGSNPPALEFYDQSPSELFVKIIGNQLGAQTTIDYEAGKFAWDIPGEPTNIIGSLQLPELGVDISTIDELLEEEYEDYFEEELETEEEEVTLASIRNMLKDIEQQTGTRSVIIYALSYPEALELLLITPHDEPIIRKIIPAAPASQLHSTVRRFRRQLSRISPSYHDSAQQLHRWLIAPIQDELASYNIDTLIFAMSSGLRSIPMAALHDGNKFLVEQYSLGMIPSVSLTNNEYRSLENSPVLAMGASKFQTLEPLPAVPLELEAIANTRATISQPFLNETFTFANLQTHSQKSNHQIVHLATHAKFQAGNADESYIQFWQDAVGMEELRSLGWYQQPQVELLVLSACETALGDAQAELGFAGLAVQTGAKSALASLWQVSDVGTLALMNQLYGQLGDPDVPIKAEALRQAQLALLGGDVTVQDVLAGVEGRSSDLNRYAQLDLAHPFYWSGFTLVGSPW
ncbi:MAG: CHAT domain-containing protein [Spirulina sp. SIO3F2]|nr:CHAT domain-containing protein [Spirulina sp. SIO3F2]